MVGVALPKIYFPSSSAAAAAAAAELQLGSDEWVRIRAEVWGAMESHGCFEAVFPELFTGDLRATMFSAAKELFDLPKETKMRIGNDATGHGYVWNPDCPLYESVGINDAIHLANIQSFTHILWPLHGNSSFSEAAHSTMKQLAKLDRMVRKAIMESLGVEKYYEESIESTYYLYRMIKYQKPGTKEAGVVLRHHTDANLLTILFQNNVSGLEVQDHNGDWLPALTTPNSFVVLAGDTLMAWSNGRVASAKHRVAMKGDEERYSMALFAIPRLGHTVQAPQELIDGEHPLLFKPYDHMKYLAFRYAPENTALEFPLEAFCGV